MGKVVVFKGEDGQLHGFGESGERAWQAWVKHVEQMEPGDTVDFSWLKPRSLPHHRKFFAKVHRIFDSQERFDHPEKLRVWLTTGAGYADFHPGPGGSMIAVPQSIAFDRMDEVEFAELHKRVDAFLYTKHAIEYLWPSLGFERGWQMVDNMMLEFDRQ